MKDFSLPPDSQPTDLCVESAAGHAADNVYQNVFMVRAKAVDLLGAGDRLDDKLAARSQPPESR